MIASEVAASEKAASGAGAGDLAALPVADGLDDLLDISTLCADGSGAWSEDGHQHEHGTGLDALFGGNGHHGAGGPFASRFADPFGDAHDGDHAVAHGGGCAGSAMTASASGMKPGHDGLGASHEGHGTHGAHDGHSGAHSMTGEHGDHQALAANGSAHGGHADAGEDGEHSHHAASASASHAHETGSAHEHAGAAQGGETSGEATIALAQNIAAGSEGASLNKASTDDGALSHDHNDTPSIDEVLSAGEAGQAGAATGSGADEALALAFMAGPDASELALAAPPLI